MRSLAFGTRIMRNLKAAAIDFGLVFGAGFVLGAIRVPFLVGTRALRPPRLAASRPTAFWS